MQKDLIERIMSVEEGIAQVQSEMLQTLQRAYKKAVERQDTELAADLARKIRNKLLDESDKQCALDKVMPPAPTGTTFTDWLDWLKALSNVSNNEWGTYRQALRDLPEQEGFPLNVIFPEAPDKE